MEEQSAQEEKASPISVTVAAYGPSAAEIFDPTLFDGPRLIDHGPEVPWDAREKVTVAVEPSESLASVIDRGAAEFGLSRPRRGVRMSRDATVSDVISGVAFYKEADDLRYAAPYPWLSLFPCVDERGQLFWNWIGEARYADLVRAYEQDLLPGDPRRVYLWPMVPQGGEVLFGSWPDLLDTLRVFLEVAGALSAVYGTAQFFGAVKRRLAGAEKIAVEGFDCHNAGPNQIDELLSPVHHATMIALKGKSYRLRERGLDVVPAAQAPSLRDSA